MGVKRADKRRLDELRVEVGVKERFKKTLVRRRLKLARHGERMGDGKLTKRADAEKVEGKRRRGRPRMRWEDSTKRDLEKVGGGRRTTAGDRSWRLLSLIENKSRRKVRRKKR